MSDASDLSLPGVYERYGGGSSDEEAAERHYKQVSTPGGQTEGLTKPARSAHAGLAAPEGQTQRGLPSRSVWLGMETPHTSNLGNLHPPRKTVLM
jgi:hypothetical protein